MNAGRGTATLAAPTHPGDFQVGLRPFVPLTDRLGSSCTPHWGSKKKRWATW